MRPLALAALAVAALGVPLLAGDFWIFVAIEIVWQLRGTCGTRQVANARVGLAHTVGRGANACVMIFRRD